MQADAKNESNAKTKEKDVRRARLIGFSITRHTTAFGGSMYRRIPTWEEECKRECADDQDTEEKVPNFAGGVAVKPTARVKAERLVLLRNEGVGLCDSNHKRG